MKNAKTIFVAGILVAYIAILVKLIVFKYSPGMVFDMAIGNYLPFKTILPYLTGEPTWTVAIRNLVGNIVPFIPLGLIAPFLYRPLTWKYLLAVAIVFAGTIEGMQVILRTGIFDIDDILLNAFGILIGYILFVTCAYGRHTQTRSLAFRSSILRISKPIPASGVLGAAMRGMRSMRLSDFLLARSATSMRLRKITLRLKTVLALVRRGM